MQQNDGQGRQKFCQQTASLSEQLAEFAAAMASWEGVHRTAYLLSKYAAFSLKTWIASQVTCCSVLSVCLLLSGLVTPNDVADRLISFLERHNSKHHWLSAWTAEDIRQQAAAATERYAAGKSLSVLDGVPFCVKDAIDALPYETSFGTTFMGKL